MLIERTTDERPFITLSQVYHLLFESWQGNTHTADEDERTLVGCALDEHFLAVVTIDVYKRQV